MWAEIHCSGPPKHEAGRRVQGQGLCGVVATWHSFLFAIMTEGGLLISMARGKEEST